MRTATFYAATTSRAWRWLVKRGWSMAPAPGRTSNATDARHKTILLLPNVHTQPGLRHRKYVIPHEIAHALHAEILAYECSDLMAARRLDRKSAVEAVAQAYIRDGTWRMATWIRGGIAWHRGHGYRYRWSDVTSPEARAIAARLRAAIA